MKFLLLGDWPTNGGSMIVPSGALIEWEAGAEPTWRGTRLPLPMPLNARAMDQASLDAMVDWYTPILIDNFLHLLHYAKGLTLKGSAA